MPKLTKESSTLEKLTLYYIHKILRREFHKIIKGQSQIRISAGHLSVTAETLEWHLGRLDTSCAELMAMDHETAAAKFPYYHEVSGSYLHHSSHTRTITAEKIFKPNEDRVNRERVTNRNKRSFETLNQEDNSPEMPPAKKQNARLLDEEEWDLETEVDKMNAGKSSPDDSWFLNFFQPAESKDETQPPGLNPNPQ